jgi:tetratricopeptide (TPR) repeat protein
MRAFLALLFTVLLSVSSVAETSVERGAALDALFGKLQARDRSSETFQAEQKIWRLWSQSDSNADDLLLADATRAMEIRDFTACEKLLNQLIASNPRYSEAWNKRATLYYLMGRLDESLADIVKTLELEPRHFGALSGRGMIYELQGKQLDALRAYREALTVNPHLYGARLAIEKLKDLEPEL